MNIVTVTGNLTKDPELRQSSTGTSIGRGRIAVSRDRKEANGEYATDFFDVVAWGGQADFFAKNLRKGNKVCISGSIHVRDWTDKDGNARISVEIHADRIESLQPKQEQTQPAQPAQKQQAKEQPQGSQNLESIDVVDDDLPF